MNAPMISGSLRGIHVRRWPDGTARIGVESVAPPCIYWSETLSPEDAARIAALLTGPGEEATLAALRDLLRAYEAEIMDQVHGADGFNEFMSEGDAARAILGEDRHSGCSANNGLRCICYERYARRT